MSEITYSFIKDGIVTNMAVFNNPDQNLLEHFKQHFNADTYVISTENSEIGGTYVDGLFWRIQPHASWTKNYDLNRWDSPVPRPEFNPQNPKEYMWNEDILNWEEIQVSE